MNNLLARLGGVGALWWSLASGKRAMPEEYLEERIFFKLCSAEDIEAERLGDAFVALAREYELHLADSGVSTDQVPAKLFVTRVRTGSIEFDIATVFALYMAAQGAADGFVIWAEFFERIKKTLSYLTGRGARPPSYNPKSAENFNAFLNTIAGQKGSSLRTGRGVYYEKTDEREVFSAIDLTEHDLVHAQMTLIQDLANFSVDDDATQVARHVTEPNVLFIWYRTDRDKARSRGQTSDRGIVAKISTKPLPVYFQSTVDNYKDRMNQEKYNVFNVIYMVDVSVEYDSNGSPKSYTILNLHRTIRPDE